MKNILSSRLARIAGVVGLSAAMMVAQPLAVLADQTIDDNVIINGNLTVHGFTASEKAFIGGVNAFMEMDGQTIDEHNTTFQVAEPTQGNVLTFPDASGTVTVLGNSPSGTGLIAMTNDAVMTGTSIGGGTFASSTINDDMNLVNTTISSDGTVIFNTDDNALINISKITTGAIASAADCVSTASPASCGSEMTGSVALPAAALSLVVNSSAVTANSQIFVIEDVSLGAKLGITCQATIANRVYSISARTAGTSFTIRSSGAPITNKACLSFMIIN